MGDGKIRGMDRWTDDWMNKWVDGKKESINLWVTLPKAGQLRLTSFFFLSFFFFFVCVCVCVCFVLFFLFFWGDKLVRATDWCVF